MNISFSVINPNSFPAVIVAAVSNSPSIISPIVCIFINTAILNFAPSDASPFVVFVTSNTTFANPQSLLCVIFIELYK